MGKHFIELHMLLYLRIEALSLKQKELEDIKNAACYSYQFKFLNAGLTLYSNNTSLSICLLHVSEFYPAVVTKEIYYVIYYKN